MTNKKEDRSVSQNVYGNNVASPAVGGDNLQEFKQTQLYGQISESKIFEQDDKQLLQKCLSAIESLKVPEEIASSFEKTDLAQDIQKLVNAFESESKPAEDWFRTTVRAFLAKAPSSIQTLFKKVKWVADFLPEE